MKKKLLILLLAFVMVLSCVLIIACKPEEKDPDDKPNPPTAEKVLDTYIFEHDGKLLKSDITLPLQIGGKDATWTSDNAAITIAKGAAAYSATVTRGDADVAVNLTVTVGEENKTFTVRVKGIDIYDIADAYKFKQERATVVADFDLDNETTFLGKKATIKWSVDPSYSAYLEINAAGDKCIVHQSSMNPPVRINAEFDYNGVKITKEYMFNVSQQKTHAEEVDFWYKHENVAMALKGYIVAIADPYSAQYKNVSFYMIDEDFCSGYYVYRGSASAEVGTTLKVGDYVEVSANVNSTYEGLYEVNQGATVTRGDKAALSQTELDAKIYDLDNDLIAGSYNATKRQSTMVKVTKWVVKEVKTAPDAGKPGTMLILEKDGKTIQISSSKYLKGAYNHAADDETWKALVDKCASLKAGDIVTVTGLLGCYKELQIQPLNANAIVVETAGDDAAAYKDAHDAGLLIAEINKMIADNKLGAIVTSASDIVLPVSKETATAAYEVMVTTDIVKVVEGTLKIVPSVEEKINVKFTVTAGEYTVTDFFTIWSKNMSDAEKANAEKITLRVGAVEDAGTVDLASAGATFTDVAITWAFKGDVADTLAKIENGKLVIVALPKEATTITLVATLKCNEATATKEIKVAIPAWEPKIRVTAEKLELGSYGDGEKTFNGVTFEYKQLGGYGDGIQMRVKEGQPNSTVYNTTKLPGSVTTIDFVWAAGKSVDADVEDKMKIEFSKNNEFHSALTQTKYLSLVKGQKNYTVEAPEGNYTYVRVTINVSGGTYWELIAINHDNVPVDDTPSPEVPAADKIAAEKTALTSVPVVTFFADYALAAKGTEYSDVAITWAIKETCDFASIVDGKLHIASFPATETQITLVATLACGDATSETKEFEVTVPAHEDTVLDAEKSYRIKLVQEKAGKTVYMLGTIKSNYVQTTETAADAFEVKAEVVDGGYNLTITVDGAKKYLNLTVNGKYTNFTIDDTAKSVWIVKDNVLLTDNGSGVLYAIGTSASTTYTTLGMVTGSNNFFAVIEEIPAV